MGSFLVVDLCRNVDRGQLESTVIPWSDWPHETMGLSFVQWSHESMRSHGSKAIWCWGNDVMRPCGLWFNKGPWNHETRGSWGFRGHRRTSEAIGEHREPWGAWGHSGPYGVHDAMGCHVTHTPFSQSIYKLFTHTKFIPTLNSLLRGLMVLQHYFNWTLHIQSTLTLWVDDSPFKNKTPQFRVQKPIFFLTFIHLVSCSLQFVPVFSRSVS